MKQTETVVNGFIIVPPMSPWDEENLDTIIGGVYASTFGSTPERAWRRWIGSHPRSEMPTIVQRWHDKGYRVAEATLTVRQALREGERG
jgi:hypothetical protein